MSSRTCNLAVVAGLGLLALLPVCSAQDRDRDRDRDRDLNNVDRVFERLDPGTMIPVRTNNAIDVERSDNRVYYGIVDQDVRGENGRIAIPRGSTAELMVRVAQDNDLILDLE